MELVGRHKFADAVGKFNDVAIIYASAFGGFHKLSAH